MVSPRSLVPIEHDVFNHCEKKKKKNRAQKLPDHSFSHRNKLIETEVSVLAWKHPYFFMVFGGHMGFAPLCAIYCHL